MIIPIKLILYNKNNRLFLLILEPMVEEVIFILHHAN